MILHLPISTKLTRANFLAWKSQILPALHGHGLYQYLVDSPPAPNLTVDGVQSANPAYFRWYKQDQLLLSWIRSSLSESILNQVVSCTTSAAIWSQLQHSFSASSRARLTELRRSLQTTTKGGSSCFDYCQRMRAIADELAFIGSPVSDDDLVIQVLTGLGADFNSVVAAANSRENLSFAELQSMLLSHESLLLSQMGNSSSLSTSAAFFTNPRPGQRPSHSTRPNKGGRSRGYILPSPLYFRPRLTLNQGPILMSLASPMLFLDLLTFGQPRDLMWTVTLCVKFVLNGVIMPNCAGIALTWSITLISLSPSTKRILLSRFSLVFKPTMLTPPPSPRVPNGTWTRGLLITSPMT